MSDIVERLRQGIERGGEGDAETAMYRAADEIERLQELLAKTGTFEEITCALRAEVGRLKAVLRALLAETIVSDEAEILRGIAARTLAPEGK